MNAVLGENAPDWLTLSNRTTSCGGSSIRDFGELKVVPAPRVDGWQSVPEYAKSHDISPKTAAWRFHVGLVEGMKIGKHRYLRDPQEIGT